MEDIRISQASPEEVSVLQQIGKQTFFEAFAHCNTESDMKQYLDNNFSKEKVLTELNNPESFFYIVWDGPGPIGYLKLNTGQAQTDLKEADSLEIERIYVLGVYHGKKVGQLLYEKALEVAQLQHKSSIWLGVWENNKKAIRFYEKNGFVPFSTHVFRLGEDDQTDLLMRKVLE
ncbi:GNAT family N-acetyltransferase [Chitinophaga pinensis]|uniref:GCN5-related N-acetyltransferase n=1 Tax=Chitinophaga pinensis (strain ATCC 43595 / DSM 2588 / LMG 13176 / NBRC 15968 / NCIMB 11800 / UQM 2034) TaxID=485918 RepID=A0A979G3P0_CHIPD|nr:GNAT family N-acetyltransferase [Chitinophaga pinensis]ACU60121.1 GCN5-related N-acetyltransferase [Chitinophaga pinensis DSM 2588]